MLCETMDASVTVYADFVDGVNSFAVRGQCTVMPAVLSHVF